MLHQIVTINSLKFDLKIHRTWKAKLIERHGSQLEFVGIFEEEIIHPKLGVIRPGTLSREYYWLDRWYSIFRFHEPDNSLRNFYCNVNIPPIFEGSVLKYVDLDIDVVVWKDFSFHVLDRDEFEVNKIKYSYSPEIISKVDDTVEELITMINKKDFPFY